MTNNEGMEEESHRAVPYVALWECEKDGTHWTLMDGEDSAILSRGVCFDNEADAFADLGDVALSFLKAMEANGLVAPGTADSAVDRNALFARVSEILPDEEPD